MAIGGLVYFLSEFRKEGFIGGDHMFSIFHGLQDIFLCPVNTTHKFHHHMDIRVLNDLHGVLCQDARFNGNPPISIKIKVGDLFDNDLRTHPAADNISILQQDLHRACPNGPESNDSHIDLLHGSLFFYNTCLIPLMACLMR